MINMIRERTSFFYFILLFFYILLFYGGVNSFTLQTKADAPAYKFISEAGHVTQPLITYSLILLFDSLTAINITAFTLAFSSFPLSLNRIPWIEIAFLSSSRLDHNPRKKDGLEKDS